MHIDVLNAEIKALHHSAHLLFERIEEFIMFLKRGLISFIKKLSPKPMESPTNLKTITEGKAKLILSTVKTNDKGEKFIVEID